MKELPPRFPAEKGTGSSLVYVCGGLKVPIRSNLRSPPKHYHGKHYRANGRKKQVPRYGTTVQEEPTVGASLRHQQEKPQKREGEREGGRGGRPQQAKHVASSTKTRQFYSPQSRRSFKRTRKNMLDMPQNHPRCAAAQPTSRLHTLRERKSTAHLFLRRGSGEHGSASPVEHAPGLAPTTAGASGQRHRRAHGGGVPASTDPNAVDFPGPRQRRRRRARSRTTGAAGGRPGRIPASVAGEVGTGVASGTGVSGVRGGEG